MFNLKNHKTMKKLYLLFVIMICIPMITAKPQSQTVTEEFTDLTATSDVVSETAFNYMGYESSITMNADVFLADNPDINVNDPTVEFIFSKDGWDAAAFWVRPFDLTAAPYIELRIMALEGNGFSLNMGTESESNGWTFIGKDIVDDGQFHVYNYDFTGQADDDIKQLGIQPEGMGSYDGSFYVDYIKAGYHARPDRNHTPTINKIYDKYLDKNPGAQTVILTGISDGETPSNQQTVTVSAAAQNSTLIPTLNVSKLSDSTAKLIFTPATDETGESNILVQIEDSGPNETTGQTGDVNTKNVDFLVTVGNDAVDLLNEELVDIYPNPVSDGVVNISLPDGIYANSIAIADITGKQVFSLAPQAGNKLTLNVDQLPAGLYILTLDTSKGTIRSKLIIE